MGMCVADTETMNLVDKKEVYPPKKAMLNNPFFPKHLYQAKPKKKKWVVFIIFHLPSFFLDLIYFVVNPDILSLLLYFGHNKTFNLPSTSNVSSSTWTWVSSKSYDSHEAYLELFRYYFQVDRFIVTVYFVVCFYLLCDYIFKFMVKFLHSFLWTFSFSFVLYVRSIQEMVSLTSSPLIF